MKRATIAVGLLAILMCLGVMLRSSNVLRAKSSGWQDISPGHSFAGWTRVAIPPDRPLRMESQWSLDSTTHTIICAGDGGHEWLRYDRELEDFVFQAEWRLIKQAGKKKYNSGIFIRNNANGMIWYQAQVGSPNAGFLFGDNPEEDGSLRRFNLRSVMKGNRLNEVGEWNTYSIRCQGKKIVLSVNGAETSEFDRCNNPKGYLGLEAEGSRIEFRHLRVKVLP